MFACKLAKKSHKYPDLGHHNPDQCMMSLEQNSLKYQQTWHWSCWHRRRPPLLAVKIGAVSNTRQFSFGYILPLLGARRAGIRLIRRRKETILE